MPRRCALGCQQNRNIGIHKFPHPIKHPEIFKAWVEIIGGKLNSPSDYKRYADNVICDAHFTPQDRNRNNRLNAMAVPSLYIDGELASPLRKRKVRKSTSDKPVINHKYSAAGMVKVTQTTKQIKDLSFG